MVYPLPTDLVNGTTGLMKGIADWAYVVTGGWFWTALLFGFCVVLGIATSRYTTERAFGFAGVTGLLGSLFLVTLNLMTWKIALFFILAGIAGIGWMIVKRE